VCGVNLATSNAGMLGVVAIVLSRPTECRLDVMVCPMQCRPVRVKISPVGNINLLMTPVGIQRYRIDQQVMLPNPQDLELRLMRWRGPSERSE